MFKNLLAVAALSFASVAICAPSQLLPSPEGAKVDFTAEAQMTVPNDQATIVLSGHAESESLQDAQSNVNTLMKEAVEAIKGLNANAEFKTINYTIRPFYSDSKAEKKEITNWEAVQRISLTTKDVQEVPELVGEAQKNGLGLSSISYSLTNETLLKTNEALIAEVVKDANTQASDIAKAMEIPLNSFSFESIKFDEEAGIGTPLLLSARGAKAAHEDFQVPVFDPGTSEVRKVARVTLKITKVKETKDGSW